MSNNTINRARGSLIGLAIGDALGAPLEFKEPNTFEPITDMISGGVHDLDIGQWTDDTSMALCLAESLIKTQGFNPIDQSERYLSWFRSGHLSVNGECFDIGNTTRNALINFENRDSSIDNDSNSYYGLKDSHSAGNGSIMRLAPVPIFYFSNPKLAIEYGAKSSMTTHAHKLTIDACKYMAGIIFGGIIGHSKEEILSSRYSPVNDNGICSSSSSGCSIYDNISLEIDEIACGSFKEKNPPEIIGSGYVVKSLEAALWAFYNTDNFEDGCLAAVNLGNDADTTGSVYGQIAGAYYGEDNIPKNWKNNLAKFDLISDFANGLLGI
ncbi:MAG: ADP-ribosylglycohydrolase family protein [Methanobacteriaceae archaeon]